MCGHQGGKEKGGMNWEIAADSYTLLYIKLVTYENLLHSIGNSTQRSVVTYMGRKSKNEQIPIQYS